MLEPISQSEWDRFAAAHLLNRAGFGSTPSEIGEAVRRGPEATVDRLLAFVRNPGPVDPPGWIDEEASRRGYPRELRDLPDEERRERQGMLRREDQRRLLNLRMWWLQRMRDGPHPLQEKLTLFWHGHFATSHQKVNSAYAMWRQNQTLREHAAGNWRDMLFAISQDPAMLHWLDNARSNRRAPNENYARELMELFTLGEGHYTEEDIRESARAFTGWSIERERWAYQFRAFLHDPGEKSFFGQRGNFDGADIIRILLEQPRAAAFIVRKLWTFFAYENPGAELAESLAARLRQANYELVPVLREMFLSRAFYSGQARRSQVKSPVQWLVGSARLLETPLPPPQQCDGALRSLGQILFAPPNVKGWDGGLAWITPSSLLLRYNYAVQFLQGRNRQAPDLTTVLEWVRQTRDLGGLRERLCFRLYQDSLGPADQAALDRLLAAMPPPSEWTQRELRTLLQQMMSTPHYQLV